MTQRQAGLLETGIHRLTWKRSGSVLAMVGRGPDGPTWYVTQDATRHSMDGLSRMASTRWSIVARADPVLCVDVTP